MTYINDLLKTSDLKKIYLFLKLNSKKKIVLISIKNNLKTSDIENLGAEFYGRLIMEKIANIPLFLIVYQQITKFFRLFSTWS